MPINIINTEQFAELRQSFGYYVDKTRFLIDFLQDPTNSNRFRSPGSASLFTRPRRFGKTLFMSMLAEFFDIKKHGDGQNLFEGLAVSANEKLCQEWMHQYPVISISLKDVSQSTFSESFKRIQRLVSNICDKNNELLNSSILTIKDRDQLKLLYDMETDTEVLGNALLLLTKTMNRHYGKQVILLIDEYDVPVAKAAEKGYYGEMIDFMRDFLSQALKSNDYLKFAILTGALRVTKESIFTGLNNLKCFDISSHRYADIFGFTQTEVDKMLAKAGCEDSRDIIREWYDGYHFGNRTDMYCPWSIMSYLEDLQDGLQDHLQEQSIQPKPYWVGTSANALSRDFVSRLPDEANVYGNFAALLAGDSIAAKLNPFMNYVDIFTDADNFWTLLYLTGYLTLTQKGELSQMDKLAGKSLLAIPNREVRDVFQTEVEAWVKKILPKNLSAALYEALWEQDAAKLEKQLTAILEGCSFHDAKESYYHGMMYGLLLPSSERTDSNRESGDGLYDLVVPDKENSRAAVLEFKRASAKDKLEAGVRDAMKQIEEKKYDERARKEGYKRILRVGIAFFGKLVKVGFEEVQGKVDSPAS